MNFKKYLNFLTFFLVITSSDSFSQVPFILTDSTPIIFSDPNSSFLIDKNGNLSFIDIQNKLDDFSQISINQEVNSNATYWIRQNIVSFLDNDIELRLGSNSWDYVESYIVNGNGKVKTLPIQGSSFNYNKIINFNPINYNSSKSQYGLFKIKKGETIQIFSRVESGNFFIPKNLQLQIYDNSRYLELRRFGVYWEGILLGVLFALAFFGYFSAYKNNDSINKIYAIWLTFAFLSTFMLPFDDGQRLFEFFINIDGVTFKNHALSKIFFLLVSYGQTIIYVIFAKYFLDIKHYFPLLNNFLNLWIVWEIAHFIFVVFVDYELPYYLIVWPLLFLILLVLILIFIAAYIRFKQGLKIAKLFMYAMIPYFFFRSIFIFGIAGVPSPFEILPDSGIGFFLRNPNTSQAFGLCCEALIMALAVLSRSKQLQVALEENIRGQKKTVENQNRVLEFTVEKRTQELQKKNLQLENTHQLVTDSINYASRIQRGQLPRKQQISTRFSSFDAIWEPRDTIGGDLWWISPLRANEESFILVIADCTGHGVPGAMVSLLLSNSLERIYASSNNLDPGKALIKLDQYLRSGLNQDKPETESDDGCDIAIFRITKNKKLIEFSGARIGFFQVKSSGQVLRHTPSKLSLGYKEGIVNSEIPELKMIPYDEGDLFVVVTDGFTDQIGHKNDKKISFGFKRLEKFLAENFHYRTNEIASNMMDNLENWQKSEKRRDDITVIIFKI